MADRSEWGRLNAGQVYGILAVDVDRALACADLGKYEQIVMQAVRERSWGTSARRKRRGEPWPEPEPARIDMKALAEEIGVPWQRLYAARKWLTDAKLIVSKDGGYMPNKNACEWIDPKTEDPLLTLKMIAYAARACTRSEAKTNPPAFTQECESDSRRSVNGVHTLHGTAFTQECESDSVQSVNGHIEEPARNLDPTGLDIRKSVCVDGPDTHTRPQKSLSPGGGSEVIASVREAARILEADPRTGTLGSRLLAGFERGVPSVAGVDPWRWSVAARKLSALEIDDSARQSLPYLAKAARNLSEADRFAEPVSAQAGADEVRTIYDVAAETSKVTAAIRAKMAAQRNGSHKP